MGLFSKIVVGTDYSGSSRAAFEHAAYVAGETGAELHLVHVISTFGDNPLVEAFRSATDEDELLRRLLAESDRLMQLFVDRSTVESTRLKMVHTRDADAAGALLAYARDQSADMIVAGTHGRRGVKRLVLGSVTARLLAGSDVPVLIARSGSAPTTAGSPVHRILLPLDLSEASVNGLEFGHKLAQLYHAQLDILHVIEPYALPVSLTGVRTVRDLVPDLDERASDQLEKLVEELKGPFVPYRIHIIDGRAASTIVSTSKDLESGMIVIPKTGMSGTQRLLLGSVAERVSRAAECPMIVLPVGDDISSGMGSSRELAA